MRYEPMEVTIVTDDDGSTGPEPGFDPKWSRIERLQWKAGIIKAETGVRVRFSDGGESSGPGYHYEWPELISVSVTGPSGSSSTNVHDQDMDMFLYGVEAGARAVTSLEAK